MAQKAKVIFRRFPENRGGDVIALFPELPGDDLHGHDCLSCQQVGQHGAACPGLVVSKTRGCTPEQYEPLKRELESLGYDLEVIWRFTRQHRAARRAAVAQI